LYFSQFLRNQGVANNYQNYDFQHTTEDRQDGDTRRSAFKQVFQLLLDDSAFVDRLKQHYAKDYELISKVTFWRG
jgi:hypothetical protein